MTKDEVYKMLKFETRSEVDRGALKAKNPKETGMRVWWDFSKSSELSVSQKNRISRILKDKLAPNGVLVVSYKKKPTALKNQREALLVMTRLVAHALKEDDQAFKQTRTSSQQDTLMRRGRRGK
jgi:hypothetical protein